MDLKTTIKEIILRCTGITVCKKLPFGLNPYNDIQRCFKKCQFKVFFDIGANTGQTVRNIHRIFPYSDIWSFEPVKETFQILKNNVAQSNVKTFQIGFGAKEMERNIYVNNDNQSDMNSIKTVFKKGTNMVIEKIKIETLDHFCNKNSVKKIDYVKIDTEGYDFEVIKGASGLLKRGNISFIEVEVSMNPENTYHINLESIKNYLEKYDYRIFGIYEQTLEWPSNTPILRRVNVLFIAKAMYSIYKQS